ncbi:hypothetical protein PGT21_016770 [Puccinia graminis f. sp. tritici]|uniref:Uncharacterized protein n=1 Tax=Puccinia graminis f. sp. tritici TaxID=56615 RepID=A0A5B0N1Z7_PUCGR|nr:hypothetical protein PGT21_016770 [Puccinia graminis f. sp. tritici]KAA1087937.1 hypothetical protein PGTUg99_001255 [Puccinia graminis f. sp. tritici]
MHHSLQKNSKDPEASEYEHPTHLAIAKNVTVARNPISTADGTLIRMNAADHVPGRSTWKRKVKIEEQPSN